MASTLLLLLAIFILIQGEELRAGFSHPSSDSSPGIDSELHSACRGDSVVAVETVLNSIAPELVSTLLNSRGSFGHTPLIAAAVAGSNDIVKVLLSRGADVQERDAAGYSALDAAAFHGRASVVGTLVKAGLNPNELHADGYAPLHRAAWGLEKRHTETVKALLRKGHVMVRSRDGKTAQELTKNRATLRVLKTTRRQGEKREGGLNLLYLVALLPLGVVIASWTLSNRIRSGKPSTKSTRRPSSSSPTPLATITEDDEIDEILLHKKVN